MEAVYAENLTKRFGGFTAVDHVSFSVEKGEVFGFLGPNGAGKTTTISMLCTLLQPTEGQAAVSGFDVMKDANEVRKRIGVVTEKLIVYDRLTPPENLKVFGRLYDVPSRELNRRIEELLKLVDLWEWRNHRRYRSRVVGNLPKPGTHGLIPARKLAFGLPNSESNGDACRDVGGSQPAQRYPS